MKTGGFIFGRFDKDFWACLVRRAGADFGPSIALILAGVPIALDYGRTGRVDLLLGGLLVSLMGLALADLVAGTHLLSRATVRATPFLRALHPRVPLALIGLATTFTLLIGEVFVFVQRHPLTPAGCLDPCVWADVTADPSFLKILATAFLFPAASAMNLPGVHDRLARSLSVLEIKCLQNLCGLGGAALIGMFGLIIGAFSAVAFGVLCGYAHLMSFFIRSAALEPRSA